MPTCSATITQRDKSLREYAKTIIRHNATTTTVHLYAIHFLNYIVPAVNVAILTRRLTPSCYGRLVIAQSLGYTVAMFTEYGFQWTGARAIAERAAGETLGPLVSSIAAAKLFIAFCCAILIPLYLLCIRSMSGQITLILGGFIWGVIQGNDLQWYFLGRERLRSYLTIDSVMRVAAAVLILSFIHSDHDVGRVLLLQSACTLVLLTWAGRRMATEVGIVRPHLKQITAIMRDGGTLFLQRLARYGSSTANTAVLGIVAPPTDVAFFGVAEKLVRYLSSLTVPLTQVIYPKLSRKAAQGGESAVKRLAILGGVLSLIVGSVASLLVFGMPRQIIMTLYGWRMLPALLPLKILAVFPILNSLTSSLVFYWLLPKRMERLSLYVLVMSGIVNVAAVALLGRMWKSSGAATAVVLTEAIALIGYAVLLRCFSGKTHEAHGCEGRLIKAN